MVAKRLLSLLLVLGLLLTGLPAAVLADGSRDTGYTRIALDGHTIFDGSTVSPVSGVSYDPDRNELTLDSYRNPDAPGCVLELTDVGSLTLTLKGSSAIGQIHATSPTVATVLTIGGDGYLSVNQSLEHDIAIAVDGMSRENLPSDTRLLFQSAVTLDLYAPEEGSEGARGQAVRVSGLKHDDPLNPELDRSGEATTDDPEAESEEVHVTITSSSISADLGDSWDRSNLSVFRKAWGEWYAHVYGNNYEDGWYSYLIPFTGTYPDFADAAGDEESIIDLTRDSNQDMVIDEIDEISPEDYGYERVYGPATAYFAYALKEGGFAPARNVHIAPQGTLRILGSELPEALFGQPYSAYLSASASGTVTWAIAEGRLPMGLNIREESGEIYGNPSEYGTFSFTVSATAGGDTVTKAMRIEVVEPVLGFLEDSARVLLSEYNGVVAPESGYSCFVTTNRSLTEADGALTATLFYHTPEGEELTQVLPMAVSGRTASASGILPAELGSLEQVVFSVGDQTLTYPLRLGLASTLRLRFPNSRQPWPDGCAPTLFIRDSGQQVVYATRLSWSEGVGPVEIKSLAPGDYTVSVTGEIPGRAGTLSYLSDTGLTLPVGEPLEKSLTLSRHSLTPVTVTVSPEEAAWYGQVTWYKDEACQEPVATGRNYSLLDRERLYVRADVEGTYGALDYLPSETVYADGSQSEITLTLPAREKITVRGVITKADPAGGPETTPLENGFVNASRYEGFHCASFSAWTDSEGRYTLEDVAAGTLLTAGAWRSSYGSASYTVTEADIAAAKASGGVLELDLTVPLADGYIYVPGVSLQSSGKEEMSREWMNRPDQVVIRKADGTELSHYRNSNSLVLEDPDAVSAGEKLTVEANVFDWWDGQWVSYQGVSQVAVQEENGRKTARMEDLVLRELGQVQIDYNRGWDQPFTLLVYGSDGLIYSRRDALWGLRGTIWTPHLPAGSYTVVLANQNHLDTLTPEDYDTAAEAGALTYGGKPLSVREDVTVQDLQLTSLTMQVPDNDAGQGGMNTAASGVRVSKLYADSVTIDVTCEPKSGFTYDRDRDITLWIRTNQDGQTNQGGGALNTFALSLNGRTIDINRWAGGSLSGDTTPGLGIIMSDGSISLKLTPEQMEYYGGFPLVLSTTVRQTDFQAISATCYLEYQAEGETHRDYVGDAYKATPGIELEVPAQAASGSFSIYGRGPVRSREHGDYLVTIYMGGAPVATATTDDRQGYFTASIEMDEESLYEYQDLTFTASGAYEDGSAVYTSEPAVTVYSRSDAALRTFTLQWEDHDQLNAIEVWNNGYPSGLYKVWYRSVRGDLDPENHAGVMWTATFDNPDKVTDAVVVIPRNGEEVELPLTRVEGTDEFTTALTYFPGSAPDGAYVVYNSCPELYLDKVETDPPATFADGLALLGQTSVFGSISGDRENLTFTISNNKGESIPCATSTETLSVSAAEFQADMRTLKALEPPYPQFPNIVYCEEGYLAATDGVWATDTILRYRHPEDATKSIFERQIYTMGTRNIIIWDEKAGTVTETALTMGSGGQPLDSKIKAGNQDMLEYLRTSQIHGVWAAFYTRLGDAAREAAELADGSVSSRRTASAGTAAVTANKVGPRKLNLDKALDKAQSLADDSYSWAEGAEIQAWEIRKLKDFLDANPCLIVTFQAFHRSGDPRYDVIGEVNAVYYQVGMNQIQKIIENAFGSGSAYGKEGIRGAAKHAMGAIKDGAKDYADNKVKGELFDRQAKNLANELYLAAIRINRTERGAGGLCGEGVNFDNFPTDIFDPGEVYGDDAPGAKPKPPTKQPMSGSPVGRYDPSGVIYEAVPSNTLEGATVTLYNLEGYVTESGGTISGGSLVETDTDRQLIQEVNPQVTGADGRYQWNVPEGWWRVVARKEGYASGDTGSSGTYGVGAALNATDGAWYMPVLPPQLDVNIGLISYEAPAVTEVRADPEGLSLTFSKYMQADSLTADRVLLYVGGEPVNVAGLLVPVNGETGADGQTLLASEFRISQTLREGDEVHLAIGAEVLSYAGIPMADRYDNGGIPVEPMPAVQTPVPSLEPGEVAPSAALVLTTATPGAAIYYTTDGSTPDETASRYDSAITIDGDMTVRAVAIKPGMAGSPVFTGDYTVPQAKTSGTLPAAATATVNGQSVSGTVTVAPGELILTTDEPDAVIYYTENDYDSAGVCPRFADEDQRKTYTGPIPLEEGKRYFFRIRVFKDGEYSEGLGLKLTVTGAQTNPFVDVAETAYYYKSVLWALSKNITAGTDATHFSPAAGCTRGQVVSFLWRAAGKPEPETTVCPFTDVPEKAYYYKAVLWAVENKITAGTSETTFSPNQTCTRGQIVSFLYRHAGSPEIAATENPFTDVAEKAYYYKPVMWAVANKITSGTSKTTFSPGDTCTRGQVVSFLYRDLG